MSGSMLAYKGERSFGGKKINEINVVTFLLLLCFKPLHIEWENSAIKNLTLLTWKCFIPQRLMQLGAGKYTALIT